MSKSDEQELNELKETLASDAPKKRGRPKKVVEEETATVAQEKEQAIEDTEEQSESNNKPHEYFLNNYKNAFEAVTVNLITGKYIGGRIVNYDKYSVTVKNKMGCHLIFKSAIVNISPFVKKEETQDRNDRNDRGYGQKSFKKPAYKKFGR